MQLSACLPAGRPLLYRETRRGNAAGGAWRGNSNHFSV